MQEDTTKAALEQERLRQEADAKRIEVLAQKEAAEREQRLRAEMEIELERIRAEAQKKEPPSEVRDPHHTAHPLKLTSNIYKKGHYICDKCDVRGVGTVYHCAICKFDLHPTCTFEYAAWESSKSK